MPLGIAFISFSRDLKLLGNIRVYVGYPPLGVARNKADIYIYKCISSTSSEVLRSFPRQSSSAGLRAPLDNTFCHPTNVVSTGVFKKQLEARVLCARFDLRCVPPKLCSRSTCLKKSILKPGRKKETQNPSNSQLSPQHDSQ